jgi:monofunctional glycosyltransferase
MDRSDETSGLSAALRTSFLDGPAAPTAEAGDTVLQSHPPRPLPARAFTEPVSDPLPMPVFGEGEPPEPLSADAAFSAIEAEASARSLSAVEIAVAGALREIKPHKPLDIAELVLPMPTRQAPADLGHTIPQRMFEPRFEAPQQPAFDGLHIPPSMRPEGQPAIENIERPARDYWAVLRRGIKLLAWIAIGWLALVLALIVAYRFVNTPASILILQ